MCACTIWIYDFIIAKDYFIFWCGEFIQITVIESHNLSFNLKRYSRVIIFWKTDFTKNIFIMVSADVLATDGVGSLADTMLTHVIVPIHFSDVIMSGTASPITGVLIVCSAICSGVDQRAHRSSASLDFVRGIPGNQWIPHTKGQ